MRVMVPILFCAFASGACATATTAVARLGGEDGARGKASFVQGEGRVEMNVEVAGLTPGRHRLTLSESGDCAVAGEPWNPTGAKPGKPSRGRASDAGEIVAGEDGKARRRYVTWAWTIDRTPASDIVGKTLIIQGAEGAEEREACGVIALEHGSGRG